jgi:O-antigen/teichoic acid export membrane protein
MSNRKIIAKNTIFLFSGDVIGRVLSFLIIVIISRYLGDSGVGYYGFLFSFVGIFEVFCDLGLSPYMIREVARHKKETEDYIKKVFLWKTIFSSIAVIIPIILIFFFKDESYIRLALIILAVGCFFYYIREFIGTIFQAHEKMEYYSLMILTERIIVFSLVFALALAGFGIVAIVSSFTLAYITTCIAAYVILSKRFSPVIFSINFKVFMNLVRDIIPFWLTGAFVVIYFRIGIIVLSAMQDYNVVGWYNAAYRALETLYFIPAAITIAVFPVMSQLYISNKEQLKILFNKALGYLFMVGLPIGILITTFSKEIVSLIYGPQFTNSIIALKIIIWAEVAIFLSSLISFFLSSINQQKIVTKITGIAVILSIILNFILIRYFSYVGASWAVLITETSILIFMIISVYKQGYPIYYSKIFLKPTLAAAIMFLLVWLINNYFKLNFIITILVAFSFYILTLIILRVITKDEIDLVKSFIPKLKTKKD